MTEAIRKWDMGHGRRMTVLGIAALYLSCSLGCSAPAQQSKTTSGGADTPVKAKGRPQAEPRSGESKSVDPTVRSELEKMEADKRATLLKDAQLAIEETRNALAALDKGDKKAALAALERASGKLDLVVARDPKMTFAPVNVTTTILDLYATPAAVKAVVKNAKDFLASDRVQEARFLIQDLASEADFNVSEIPLGTYPAAIKAVAPLVDAGKTKEAKAALYAALSTLVIETFVIPLPKIRAEAMLADADRLANKKDRKEEDKARLRTLIDASRQQVQLAEALGYGSKDSYKPLYSQLDDIQKKVEAGQSGGGLFDRLRQSVRNFKFSI